MSISRLPILTDLSCSGNFSKSTICTYLFNDLFQDYFKRFCDVFSDKNFAKIEPGRGAQVQQRRQLEPEPQIHQRGRHSAKQHDPLQREDQPEQDGQPVAVEHLVEHEVASQTGRREKFAESFEKSRVKLR